MLTFTESKKWGEKVKEQELEINNYKCRKVQASLIHLEQIEIIKKDRAIK